MPQSGVRSGLLLLVIGLFVILRSTRQDSSGRTLVDHLLGKVSTAPALAPALTPAQKAQPAAPVTPAPAKNAGPLAKTYIPTPAPFPAGAAK